MNGANTGRLEGCGLTAARSLLRPGNHRLIERIELATSSAPAGVARRKQLLDARRLHADRRRPCRRRSPVPSARRAAARARRRSRNRTTPAASSALYSPRLWPATNAGAAAPSVHARAIRQRVHDEQRRLRELRQPEFAARIVHAQLADRVAEHRVGLGGPIGKPIEQIGAHAFRLGALTGKQTRDGHDGATRCEQAATYYRNVDGGVMAGRGRGARLVRATPRVLAAMPRGAIARCAG